jgi:hypothetical protein
MVGVELILPNKAMNPLVAASRRLRVMASVRWCRERDE